MHAQFGTFQSSNVHSLASAANHGNSYLSLSMSIEIFISTLLSDMQQSCITTRVK